MKTNGPVRGEVWLADFGGRKGDEICKSRPCVVVSADGLGKLRLKVVVPITGWKPRYGSNPWMVKVSCTGENGLTKDSAVDGLQVTSVTLERFLTRLGVLTKEQIEDVIASIQLVIDAI